MTVSRSTSRRSLGALRSSQLTDTVRHVYHDLLSPDNKYKLGYCKLQIELCNALLVSFRLPETPAQPTACPKYCVARYSRLAVLARWNVRAKENGAVQAGRHDLLRCAGSLARRFADRTVSLLRFHGLAGRSKSSDAHTSSPVNLFSSKWHFVVEFKVYKK